MNYLILSIVGILISAFTLIGIGTVLHFGSLKIKGLFPFSLVIILINVAVSVLLSNRTLNFLEQNLGNFVDIGISNNINRITSLIFFFLSLATVIKYFSDNGSRAPVKTCLLLSFIFYVLGNVILNGLWGTNPHLDHHFIYVSFGILAAIFSPRNERYILISVAKHSLFFFSLLSLILIFARPEMVIQQNYVGLIPGFDIRLVGLANHANQFGPLLVLLISLLLTFPFNNKIINFFSILLLISALFLTQSKTSWVTMLVCLLILYIANFNSDIFGIRKKNYTVKSFVAVTILLLTCVLMLFFTDIISISTKVLNSKQGEEISSLTGRVQIWDLSIQEWKQNKLFGYGPTIFDLNYRIENGMLHAIHAHNQFFQSLGSGGSIGVISLLVYSLTLLYNTFKVFFITNGLSLCIFSILLIQSISEIPLDISNFKSTDFFIHLFLVSIITAFTARSKK